MSKLRMIAIDVDGTLSDGKIILLPNGDELKTFNVKDGMAIRQALELGIVVVFISGRFSKGVELRAKELGVEHVFQNTVDKVNTLKEFMSDRNISFKDILFIGDDINDLKIMRLAGMTGCPLDASQEIKQVSKILSKHNGGCGAVREIIESVLKEQGDWIVE